LAATILAGLEFADIEEIYSDDYHAFLESFLDETAQLGQAVHEAYLELK
jgi:hypothetical protein